MHLAFRINAPLIVVCFAIHDMQLEQWNFGVQQTKDSDFILMHAQNWLQSGL